MSDKLERRHTPISESGIQLVTRQLDDGSGARLLKGLASVFDSESRDLGGFVEIVHEGFFRDVLEDDDEDPVGAFNHDPDNLLGRQSAGTLRLEEINDGLDYEVDLDTDHVARFVERKVERRELTGSSFAFTVKEGGDRVEKRDDGMVVRHLLPGGAETLQDVGPVTHPAYEATKVSVRALERAREAAEILNRAMVSVNIDLKRKRLELERARAGV